MLPLSAFQNNKFGWPDFLLKHKDARSRAYLALPRRTYTCDTQAINYPMLKDFLERKSVKLSCLQVFTFLPMSTRRGAKNLKWTKIDNMH